MEIFDAADNIIQMNIIQTRGLYPNKISCVSFAPMSFKFVQNEILRTDLIPF